MAKRNEQARTASGRRSFTEDFKREAVQMIFDGHSVASVSKNLGIGNTNLLYRWKAENLARSGPAAKALDSQVVQFMDKVTVQAALAGTLETFGGCEWMMNVGGRQIEKERLLLSLNNPLDGLLREGRANLVIIEQFLSCLRTLELVRTALCGLRRNGSERCSVLYFVANMHLRIVRITTDDAIVLDVHVWRRAVHNRHAEVVIKAEILRSRTEWNLPIVFVVFKTKMPLAKRRRRIIFVLEDIRNRGLFRVDDQWRSDWRRPQTPLPPFARTGY
jgi:transposase-like protein